jgi:hypothetical protein
MAAITGIERRRRWQLEQAFAKLKTLLRKAAARTQEAFWGTIDHAFDSWTPAVTGRR